MTTLRPWILAAFVGLILPVSCPADDDALMAKLDDLCKSTIARVGPELTTSITHSPPLQCELCHRGVQTTSDNKLFGPTWHGFIFRARRFSKLTIFKPNPSPFDWDNHLNQTVNPWVSEFHLFPIGGDSWLCVSIWRGAEADQQLIHELLEATAKIVEEQRRGRPR